ncbi:hypothetical protein DFQ26_005486 [Actinomortierella ambigua]|nr:hypothetical protein DFQ26_005486 [Actinomortierella ambigua]
MNFDHDPSDTASRRACSPPAHRRLADSEMDYSQEPTRPLTNFIVRNHKPFNAEPHLDLLVNAGTITPADFFFKRNHGPIPNIHFDQHLVYLGVADTPCNGHGQDNVQWKTFSMHDLMTRWPSVDIAASLQCAGNRRDGLAKVKTVKGVIWGPGTISNAVWTGVRLCTILSDLLNVPKDLLHDMVRTYHVSLEADDHVHEDCCYGSSIPLRKAMDPLGDVILAYKMNGEMLSRDHGAPLRVIVPGYIGARSVKYLQKILLQPNESRSFFQVRDYKILPPWVNSDNADSAWDSTPSLGEMNVQCVICTPSEHCTIKGAGPVSVKGYAISGGGRGIYRVELSMDGGKTWEPVDKIEQTPDPKSGMYWAWALWEKKVPRIRASDEIVARAYDSAGNTQPEMPIWNYRGVMNNAWFRVKDVAQLQPNM